MQIRKPWFLLLSCFTLLFFISCNKKSDKQSGPSYPNVPKIKTESANNDLRTFSYDNMGRLTKIVYSLYGRDEYSYTDTGVVINSYDTTNTYKGKQVYKLDGLGRAIQYTESYSPEDVVTYTYNGSGEVLSKVTTRTIPGDPLRVWNTQYYYTASNLDSVITNFTEGGVPSGTSALYYDEYFTGITSTITNYNFGQYFLGVQTKGPIKTARDIGETGSGDYPTTTYDYDYDPQGRITVQHHHWNTSSFPDLSFTYY
jgi:YD repeat-containing protein